MQAPVMKLAILGTLALAAGTACATGFVNLPANGVAVPEGTSAYVSCNVTGDFGSNPDGSTPPTATANNTCAIFRSSNDAPPLAGYVRTAQVQRKLVMKNAYTNNASISIGTVTDEVWRKAKTCIYAAKVRLNNVDYDRRAASPGPQYFEMNDFLRGGFKNRAPIAIAYHFSQGAQGSDEVLYRAGLTFTSVVNEPGDPAQPLTSVAPISTNWVDFTSDVNYLDPDGSSMRDSPWYFVRSACTTAAPAEVADVLRFRQMGQEDQPELEISIPGFAPAGATAAQ